MNIEFHRPNVYDIFFNNLTRSSSYIKHLLRDDIQNVLKNVEIAEQLTGESATSLSDEEYTKMLYSICSISLTEQDYLKILSQALGNTFVSYTTIETTMTRNITATEGRGNSFDYWNEEVGTEFDIAYAQNANIDTEHSYSVEELKKLIAEKRIVLLKEKDVHDSLPEKAEEYESFETLDLFTIPYGKHFPDIYYKYIRENINGAKIKKALKSYLKVFENEMHEIIGFCSPALYEQKVTDHVHEDLARDENLKILWRKCDLAKRN